MIIVRYCGGLGNQMYQYAIHSILREVYPSAEIKADISHYNMINEHNGFEIDSVFDTSLNYASTKEIKKISCCFAASEMFSLLPYSIRNIFAHKIQFYYKDFMSLLFKKKRQKMISDKDDVNTIYNLNVNSDWFINGMWQNIAFFHGREDTVRKSFTFRTPELNSLDRSIFDKIRKTKSVSIHVRRGDFIYNNSQFNICGKDYYEKALITMEETIGDDIQYFMFSDDPDFVETEFSFLANKEIVIHNKTQSNIDMMMMAACSHNIISNSTFSFWGAFLGDPDGRVVIAPKYCRKTDTCNYDFSIPDNWLKIEV